jgi:hypothetical protein
MLQEYNEACKRPSYNFLFSVVLLVLYEASVGTMRYFGRGQVINGVDAWFTSLLALVPYGSWVLSFCIVAAGIAYLYIDSKEGVSIRPRFFGLMLLESLVWAAILYLTLPRLIGQMFNNNILASVPGALPAAVVVKQQPTLLENIGLSFGAGFYEEFFFRLLLVRGVQLLMAVFKIDTESVWSVMGVILFCSIAFSAAHYIGNMGDSFDLYSFFYRFVFGLLMSLLLVLRRFGITAWTHALYDILVYTMR